MGHSRNLVIRGALNKVTEKEVRDHMEHIHNLIIVAFIWKGSDAFISTNSLTGSSLARLCLSSRQKYKVGFTHDRMGRGARRETETSNF